MNILLKSKPVSDQRTYEFSITIRESGGEVFADWSCPTSFEPDYAQVVLFLRGERVESHKTGKASGSHQFSRKFGKDYRLALVANDFSGKHVEVVTTGVTQHNTERLDASKKYSFSVSLKNVDNQAQLAWSSSPDAKFRPRQSQAQVVENGKVVLSPWITAPNGEIATKLRWGVGLAAAYTAEDYNGKRLDVARTPTTVDD